MDAAFISKLKQPCKNRGIELVDNKDGSVTMDGQRFETIRETEDYIESHPRQDKAVEEAKTCPSCGALCGELHGDYCDIERCQVCGIQALSCLAHADSDLPRLPWTSEWPGRAECREFGWYVFLTPGEGWARCRKDHPGASEDLNRLHVDAVWDIKKGRFVLEGQPEKSNQEEAIKMVEDYFADEDQGEMPDSQTGPTIEDMSAQAEKLGGKRLKPSHAAEIKKMKGNCPKCGKTDKGDCHDPK